MSASSVNMYFLTPSQTASLAPGPGDAFPAEINQYYEGKNMISSTVAARTDAVVSTREQQEFTAANYFMDQVITPAGIMNCGDTNRLGGRPNKNLSGQNSSCYAPRFPRESNAPTLVEFEWESQRDPSRNADSLAFSGIPVSGPQVSDFLMGAPPRAQMAAGTKGCALNGDLSMCGLTTFGRAYFQPEATNINFYAPLPRPKPGRYECGVSYNNSGSTTMCSVNA